MRRRPNLVRTNVLVIGGGLTGLSMALFLAWHRISCVVAERHEDVIRHPRMRSLPPRVLEMFRPLGLESRLAQHADTFAGRERFTVVRGETLAGHLTPLGSSSAAGANDAASPCRAMPIDQDRAERVVRRHAAELGAAVQFGVALVGFSEDDTGVMARLRRSDGSESVVRAQYMIAADGSDSAIRRRLGIAMRGPDRVSQMTSIVFEADLRSVLRDRVVHMAYVNRPRDRTFVMPMDSSRRRWVLGTGGVGIGELTAPDCEAMIHAAIGEGTSVRLLPPVPGSTRPALRLGVGGAVAERMSLDRVFLIGDAAHHIPPQGGFGSATGIADAHNLAWKIAAVLHGHARPKLLDTYHDERHPIAEFTMRQAISRTDGNRRAEQIAVADRDHVLMGYQYGADLATVAQAGDVGTRFPHRSLPSGASTIDLFGREYVVLTAEETWIAAGQDVGVTLHLVDVDLPGVGDGGAVLVRPDGFVAWRWPSMVADPREALSTVMETVSQGTLTDSNEQS